MFPFSHVKLKVHCSLVPVHLEYEIVIFQLKFFSELFKGHAQGFPKRVSVWNVLRKSEIHYFQTCCILPICYGHQITNIPGPTSANPVCCTYELVIFSREYFLAFFVGKVCHDPVRVIISFFSTLSL